MSQQQKGRRGHPPIKNQFGQGQGRAAGRPKGALGEKSIVQNIAGELHKVQQNGESVTVTTIELLLLTMRNLAMQGDLRAARWLSEYRAKTVVADSGGGFMVAPDQIPPEKFIEKEMFLNRFRTDPELRDDPVFNESR